MTTFLHHLSLSAPLFALVFAGYGLMRGLRWPRSVSDGLNRFVFNIALPAMLFRMMADLARLPPVDSRLLVAFFGSCLIVFVLGRLLAWRVFSLDGVGQSVFALGGVFSNNALLGLPLAKIALGDAAIPSVALVLVFNALTLWTLVTVSVEWSRHGSLSATGFLKTARSVLTNPIVAAILSGSAYGVLLGALPPWADAPLAMLAQAAAPLALVALGMGLGEYGVRSGWRLSATVTAMKLLVQPLVVWLLARALGLPPLETAVVVLLGATATGANVYLMARQFRALEGPMAGALVLSTGLAALTTPVVMSLVAP